MRKIAEKWLALLMAMLMLLSSMPLTALAEEQVYSEGLTITAKEAPEEGGETPDASGEVDEDALALKAVEDAIGSAGRGGAERRIRRLCRTVFRERADAAADRNRRRVRL